MIVPSGSLDPLPLNWTGSPALPVYGPPGFATGGLFGGRPTVAELEALAVAPPLSVTDRATVKTPVEPYACDGVGPLPVEPSPNVHA